ncbi:hypothetical protein [Streptomyces longwoodensis]|uniref:hypothetical protein n=1 Tax=Streptomyces longwoodensis TaxID=68231 RepID=UPI0022577E98|nr:hypothetical protein [Streptomyces longwoodensis]MCX5000996.1 hypothetical protein [Streptomyces longwoodensis]
MAQLAATVYVQDPQSHQTVTLDQGTSPEPRLAALVTNPAAWVDGKLPRLPKTQTKQEGPDQGPTGAGQDDASGDDSAADGEDADTASAAKKTAARKSAATSRSRGRDAADEGSSGN